jgi:PAS domain S-box-containing protein
VATETRPYILLLGSTSERQRLMADRLGPRYEVAQVSDLQEGRRADLVVLDLVPDPAAPDRPWPRMRLPAAGEGAPILALVRTSVDKEVTSALDAGAADVADAHLHAGELRSRVHALLRGRRWHDALVEKRRHQAMLLSLLELLTSDLEFNQIVHAVSAETAQALQVERCAVFLLDRAGAAGYVLAASEDARVRNLRVPLDAYPEIAQVLKTGVPLDIPDVQTEPLLARVRERLDQARVRSMALFPIVIQNAVAGVLFLRWSRARPALDPRAIEQGGMVASALAVALFHARALEQVRAETQLQSRARVEAENRLEALTRYRDYFEASSDGMAVLTSDGRVAYSNRAARQIAGHLEGQLLREHLDVPSAARIDAVVRKLGSADDGQGFDVVLRREDGDRTLSMAASSVLREEGHTVLTFRDVTEERAVASELSKTKDFLENLIQSTVDAVVAADINGTIILFNRGAERVFGYNASNVVGVMSAEKLYPPGQAKAVMRELRAEGMGGVGRLAASRKEIVTRDGEIVPVNITASILYEGSHEGSREVATVGIISDLRERLNIEQRLHAAQEKLLITEKQALIAELAGTTAHELNQPLTSVMGYAELLLKRMGSDDGHRRPVEIIQREAERMAEIVRKIGKITRYETKPYVGGTQILDLDKSTES